MVSGTFISEVDAQNQITIPPEVAKRLQLRDGDKIEVLIKKIRSRKLDIKISKNPLTKLLKLGQS
jgi:AbrB family looped-hinge helix DNA binding protein